MDQNKQSHTVPLTIKQNFGKEVRSRQKVLGWYNVGGEWYSRRAFDIITDSDGSRFIEVKQEKGCLRVHLDSI